MVVAFNDAVRVVFGGSIDLFVVVPWLQLRLGDVLFCYSSWFGSIGMRKSASLNTSMYTKL